MSNCERMSKCSCCLSICTHWVRNALGTDVLGTYVTHGVRNALDIRYVMHLTNQRAAIAYVTGCTFAV